MVSVSFTADTCCKTSSRKASQGPQGQRRLGTNVRYRGSRFRNRSKPERWLAPSCCSLEREEREAAQRARKPTHFGLVSTDNPPKAQQKMHHSRFNRLGA
ncbi:RRXRR domain-containing protein [Paraburkholderia dokdonensis]|uniref:RRXRR domain-containing protein n=1 Tax=Paraburkholderia dokdonensis TaxID=2211211 RepID=UPI00101A0511